MKLGKKSTIYLINVIIIKEQTAPELYKAVSAEQATRH